MSLTYYKTHNWISDISNQIGVNLTPVKSSNILAYGYDAYNKALWVLFKKYQLYKYPNITSNIFRELDTTGQKGRWVNVNLVKTKWPFEKYEVKHSGSSGDTPEELKH